MKLKLISRLLKTDPALNKRKPTYAQLCKLMAIADYQLGRGTGKVLFQGQIQLVCSRRTGRMRHIFRHNRLIATLRPKDGCLALTPYGGSILVSKMKKPPNLVVITKEVSSFIRGGGDVFAKHVVRSDPQLRPMDEAIICDEDGAILAVGRCVMSGNDMSYFKRGVAVKVRGSVKPERIPLR